MKSEVIRVLPQLENTAAEDAPVVQHLCFYCGTSHEVLLCNWCRQIYYCRKHHSIHRSRSKCFPFIVSRGGLRGRRLLASRDIKPGKSNHFNLPNTKHQKALLFRRVDIARNTCYCGTSTSIHTCVRFMLGEN